MVNIVLGFAILLAFGFAWYVVARLVGYYIDEDDITQISVLMVAVIVIITAICLVSYGIGGIFLGTL